MRLLSRKPVEAAQQEGEYNDILNGSNGRMFGYLNSDNDFQKDIINPEDGKSVVTTIDVNIQRIVDKQIEKFNNEHANVAREGAGSNERGGHAAQGTGG